VEVCLMLEFDAIGMEDDSRGCDGDG